jgi:hypothetical protein
MTVLANITSAAAELLAEANLYNGRLGVELGGTFAVADALELMEEEFGALVTECETHGFACPPQDDCSDDTYQVFIINDAGEQWLVDAGRI